MSARGIDFLEDWIAKHVTPDEFEDLDVRTHILAERCEVAANAAGLSQDDLEPEWGTVESIIRDVLQQDPGGGTPGD